MKKNELIDKYFTLVMEEDLYSFLERLTLKQEGGHIPKGHLSY